MTKRPPPPKEYLDQVETMRRRELAAKMPEWRRWWAGLPVGFRETLFRNANLDSREAGDPLRTVPDAYLPGLITAAARYAEYCRQAESWLLKERAARAGQG